MGVGAARRGGAGEGAGGAGEATGRVEMTGPGEETTEGCEEPEVDSINVSIPPTGCEASRVARGIEIGRCCESAVRSMRGDGAGDSTPLTGKRPVFGSVPVGVLAWTMGSLLLRQPKQAWTAAAAAADVVWSAPSAEE